MKIRALGLGILLLTAMVVVLAGCSGGPKDEAGRDIDVSVENVLMPAFEVYGWFADEPLEHEEQPRLDYPDYYKVIDERVTGMGDLNQAVRGAFSDRIAEKLLRNGTYIELDGALYYVGGPAELTAPSKSNESALNTGAEDEVIVREILSVVSQESSKVVYQTGVWYADESDAAQESAEVTYYDFIYEKVDGKWKFTEFEYYR